MQNEGNILFLIKQAPYHIRCILLLNYVS